MSWRLTPEEYELTRAKIGKINARAERRGFTGRLDVTGEQVMVESDVAGITVTEVMYEVTVTGEPPQYGGWTLLAALDWTDSGGLIVRTAPGVDSIDRSGLVQGKCDHCGTNRRRKKCVVVGDGTRQVQVGSTCLKDFLGWSATPVFLCEDDVAATIGGFCGTGQRAFTVESVLATAWACVTRFGFVPSRDPGSTREAVATVLAPRNRADREFAERLRPLAQRAVPMGVTLREFVLSDEFGGTSEYVLNLKTLCREETVGFRHFGLLVSAPQAWARAQERTLIRERERAEMRNEWVGAVKDRLTLNVKVRTVRFIPAAFGTKTLYTLVSDQGHVFKWFSTTGLLGEVPTDKFVTIKGTVKAHEEWQERKSTLLTNCALVKA